MKKSFFSLFAFLGFAVLLSACSPAFANVTLVNTKAIELGAINDIKIDYNSDNITFFKGTDGKIVVKEYMSKNNKRYYAKVTQHGHSLLIHSGERPAATFISYVEVYLPQIYAGSFSVKSKSGSLESQVRYKFTDFVAESLSGSVVLKDLEAKHVSVKTESGNITCAAVAGKITAASSSGNVIFTKIKGRGSFSSDSGNIELDFGKITGNITASSENGTIDFAAAHGASFKLSASTENGNIDNRLSGKIHPTENSLTGSVGDHPEYSVKLSTSSGNISVK